MDIHKPKPWRGAREFAKEIGTILIGVLLALGAEQGVEWLHGQHEVAETRKALQAEVAENAQGALFSLGEYQCHNKRLDQLMRWATGGAKPPLTLNGVFGGYYFSAYEVAKAGALARMSIEERLRYQHFYDFLTVEGYNLQRNKDIAGQIAMYLGGSTLTPEQALRMREQITAGRFMNSYIMDDDRWILRAATEFGLPKPTLSPQDRQEIDAYCKEASV
jgi:hypothetical protein